MPADLPTSLDDNKMFELRDARMGGMCYLTPKSVFPANPVY